MWVFIQPSLSKFKHVRKLTNQTDTLWGTKPPEYDKSNVNHLINVATMLSKQHHEIVSSRRKGECNVVKDLVNLQNIGHGMCCGRIFSYLEHFFFLNLTQLSPEWNHQIKFSNAFFFSKVYFCVSIKISLKLFVKDNWETVPSHQ